MSLIAFTPNTSIQAAVTATKSSITIAGTGHYLRLVNNGPGAAWLRFFEVGSPVTVTAATGLLLPAGAIEIFSVASDTTQIAALGDANGATLNVTRGEGQ